MGDGKSFNKRTFICSFIRITYCSECFPVYLSNDSQCCEITMGAGIHPHLVFMIKINPRFPPASSVSIQKTLAAVDEMEMVSDWEIQWMEENLKGFCDSNTIQAVGSNCFKYR